MQDRVPSTGYVGDSTGGRFPSQGGNNSTTSGSDNFQQQNTSSKYDDLNTNSGRNTGGDGGYTGREGVPGTVTSGDPSMGGVSKIIVDEEKQKG